MSAPKPNPAPPAPPDRRSAHAALAVAAAVLLGLLVVRGYSARYTARPTEAVAAVDLNRADRRQLEQLPGVGPTTAAAIDARRRDAGGFASVDDLRTVPGLGPATIDKLRPFVRVEPVAAAPPELPPRVRAQAPADPPPATKGALVRKIQPGEPPIDVNAADAAELQRLPGVGPVMASAIVAGRPYRSVADLDRVRGIGAKTLEKLRPFVVTR